MPGSNASEEDSMSLRSRRSVRSRLPWRGQSRAPLRGATRSVSSEPGSPTPQDIALTAANSVAVQLSGIFESFLGQLRADLQQLTMRTDSRPPSRHATIENEPAPSKVDEDASQVRSPIPTLKKYNDETSSATAPAGNAQRPRVPAFQPNRADEWIDDVVNSSEPLLPHTGHYQASFLQQLPPAITIEPFDGDPRKWDQFIDSFKALVHDVVASDAQRIAILRMLLTPRLRASIAPSLGGPRLYGQALADLRRLFGDPNLIIDAHIRALLDISPMRSTDGSDVDRLFYEVHGAINTLRAYGAIAELASRTTLQAVVSKMNKRLKTMWARRQYELRPRPADLCDLDKWLEESIVIQNSVHHDVRDFPERQTRKTKPKETRRILSAVTVDQSSKDCPICKTEHHLTDCPVFTSLLPQERAEAVKQHGRCFACFEPNHRARNCKRRQPCKIDGCRSKHHPLLHGAPRVFPALDPGIVEPKESSAHVGSNTVGHHPTEVLLSVVRVRLVTTDNISMTVDVLLDPGSEITLIREDLARKLNLNGPIQNIRLGTFHGVDPTFHCRKVSFMIHSLDAARKFVVDGALTVPKLNVSQRRIDFARLQSSWPHLQEISFARTQPEDIAVLVGMDVVGAHEQYRLLKSSTHANAPRAVLTPFGWSIIGRVSGDFAFPTQPMAPRRVHCVAPRCQNDDLTELVKHHWSIESLGIRQNNKEILSPDDQRAMAIMRSSTRKVNGRYECGMLWKVSGRLDQDSLPMAEARFAGLEKRFRRNREFAKKYTNIIEEYLQAGYAVPAPSNRGWFLPHHVVETPRKPGKIRVVFDASARANGISLNDMLLSGPDMLTNLFGLLLRFREYPVAVSSDITKMFHQVLVPDQDQTMLRFLWRTPGSNCPLNHLQMKVHIFGAVCSPAICTYVLRKNAEDNRARFPFIWQKVQDCFYVDNYLDSFTSADEAITTCSGLVDLLARGGFYLAKWMSSSRSVLKSLDPKQRLQPHLNIDMEPLPVERTLGVLWNADDDTLRFRCGELPAVNSKREMLRVVSSIFDPLGLVSPVVLRGKCILRQAWLLKAGWDDPLPEDVTTQWEKWSSALRHIESLNVPRRLTPSEMTTPVDIHIFADASELGYGSVAYVRGIGRDGKPFVSFICSKARVAPLKYQTIPRLELQAALISSRLGTTLRKEFRLELSNIHYWTDSLTVLHWLNPVGKRYHQFVSNRVAEILETSKTTQWHYVPTRANPADDCSRGLCPSKLSGRQQWFNGPAFLLEQETRWPKAPQYVPDAMDAEEIRAKRAGHIRVVPSVLLDMIQRSRNLRTVRRVVAYILRLAHNCRVDPPERWFGPFSAAELDRAMKACLTSVQLECYAEERASLASRKPLKPRSALLALTPFIHSDGTLRAQGRINRADLPYDARHPVILPRKHPMTDKIIDEAHRLLHHGSVELTLSELRQRYWLPKGRQAVKRVVYECRFCKKLRAKPVIPLMAPLPAARVQAFEPPFSRVGIDYFGPLLVLIRRSHEKRYGCIFTCLATRAVHLEISFSLDTDSFLMSFRRFTTRRGAPAVVYSDNGTNLVAGERELRTCLEAWNQAKISDALAQRQIQWHFSPPGAPHFGGSWERLIRSAKSTLGKIMNGRAVTDEVLVTIFAEVESLLNARPLTHLSVDPRDPEPLTPNHFLLGRAHPHIPPDIVAETEVSSKRKWRSAQAIVESFWRRWLKEYVPCLIERRKWLRSVPNLRVGDIVIIVDTQSPRGQWPLGTIVECLPGRDGIVRVAKVKTRSGIHRRPVSKLCLLESRRTDVDADANIHMGRRCTGIAGT